MQYRKFKLSPIKKALNALEHGVAVKKRFAQKAGFLGASSIALAMGAPVAFAQDIAELEEVVVTGIRASLDRAQDLKRNSDGIVDGISAEDIGKFPDTNLAESLQRIPGVAINRVNGEGSEVSVRGFSGAFNLVTLNGRTLPGADAPLAGTNRGGSNGNTRAFDFSNLAAEAVSGIQVYKTGKASLPSGGIGATVNIQTAKPLDNPGFNSIVSAKVQSDSSVDTGSSVTPEVSGLISWTDDSEKFGIGFFGSFQQRDSAAAASSVAGWNISTFGELLNNPGRVGPNTNIVNAPTNLEQLIGIPNDSRFHFSELERERINGQLTLQYAPSDTLTITGDVLYARNDNNETRSDIANWFGNSFSEIVVDSSPDVLTPLSLSVNESGNKDFALAQDEVGTRDELTSFGFNVDWQANDRLRFILDAHSSEAEVSPTLSSGASGGDISRIEVGAAAPFVVAQTQTFGPSGIPTQNLIINSSAPDNQNGFSITDLSTTVANGFRIRQENTVDEIDLGGVWAFNDSSNFSAGVNFRAQENTTDITNTRQVLGFWDASNPGDIAEFAPGVLGQFDLSSRISDFDTGIENGQLTGLSFRGSANELFDLLSTAYSSVEGTPNDLSAQNDNSFGVLSETFSVIEEDITSIYAAYDTQLTLGGREARLNLGLRYEETDVTSTSLFDVPTGIAFVSDNDNEVRFDGGAQNVAVDFSYSNFLPNIDLAVDVTDDLVARASFSTTIARAGFGDLVTNTNVNTFSNQSFFGGTATASSGNPTLEPLESDNFDVSFEWYYGPSSFVTAGVFAKRVDNFIGSGSVQQELFGLRDVFSGQAGTRSGDALAILQGTPGASLTNANLFTLVALIQRDGNNSAAISNFANSIQANGQSNLFEGVPGVFDGLSGTQVLANGDDPLISFLVNQSLNNQQGNIRGLELSGQHFFGDTGFGVAASFTYVDGDVDFDVNAPQGADQFALTGISDTANLTLIYENYGFSARVSYNWRDTFLASTNIGQGNPLFVDAFGQFDANVSYDVNDQLSVSFEAINIAGENLRTFTRSESQLVFAQELEPRFLLGARYKF